MENTKQLEYFWIKTESDNNINIIIKAEPSILVELPRPKERGFLFHRKQP